MHHYRKIILEQSSIIALLLKKQGWEILMPYMDKTVLSTASLCFVTHSLLTQHNLTMQYIKSTLNQIITEFYPVSQEQAFIAAELMQKHSISEQQAFSIALAMTTGMPLFTADNTIATLDLGIIPETEISSITVHLI